MQKNSTQNNLADSMKLGMRRLAAGVCILSAQIPGEQQADDQRFAMTVSSVTSVSDSPASLLVCVNKMVSQQEYLTKLGTVFAINVLSQDHQELSDLCAGRRPGKDRFDVGQWINHGAQQVPVLQDALAVFICQTDQVVTYGTHKIIIGAITEVVIHSDAQKSGDTFNPLVYADGSYGRFLRQTQ